ncbi:heterokaryon incompatibility protein-domain-containing protein [Phaeosphaeria sp. MPI-PUGE-AT-0046c]|nr:heterokaryon incompatibility protein-domain-containing protein [Phaeosphaeria sp. MPI-PUGE-AT-0046c]
MCFDNVPDGRHECIDPCPVCYFFTPENTLRLLRGDNISLGTLDLFSEVARVGCRLCAMLCRIWDSDEEGFEPKAQIRIFSPEDAPRGKIWTLYFEIDQPSLKGSAYGEETGGFHREELASSWAVPIGVFTKGTKWLDHVFPVRAPVPSVSHDEVFEQFKSSLEICLAEHASCAKPDARLPTRVLALDDPDTPDRVFLHEPQSGEEGQYIALSYCWGKTVQTKLLTSNIDDFRKSGIAIATLPQTLQDSILASRKLGIKYLWVDSLCIIQDSATDKQKEIASMAGIYKNATIVISAAVSADCGQGFLHDRASVQLRLDNSLRLPFFSEADPETRGIMDWIYLCPEAHMGYKVLRFDQEPISNRAWTYQESKLAQRLLIFGSGPPQWHCKEGEMIYGLDLLLDDLPDPNGYSRIMRRTVIDGETVGGETTMTREKVPTEDIGAWKEWFPMLENYSFKKLTVRTDKLLAISAMAAEYASPGRGIYAAGLWEASLPRSLLWRRDSAPNVEVTPPEYKHSLSWLQTRLFDRLVVEDDVKATAWASHYIAPAWSPMCCTEPIHFEDAATPRSDESFLDLSISLVTIHNIDISPTATINPYGQLDFAYLDLTAPMRRISWAELTADFVILRAGEPFTYWDYVVADDPSYFAYMTEKHGASVTPQMLADQVVQHTRDSEDASIFVGDKNVRISIPPKEEPVPWECAELDEPVVPIADVKHKVLESISQAQPSPDRAEDLIPDDECELWLLEVERSKAPAGLVLKRVRSNIFARVAYFGKNRSLDPEIVYLRPYFVQIRGPKTSRFGEAEGMSGWYDSLTRRRIYLV